MNIKRIFGTILTALGIIGLIYASVIFVNTTGGKHDVKAIAIYSILGSVFFIAGIGLVKSTKDVS